MIPWDAVVPGTVVGPHTIALSSAANERYWSAAGIDHPTLRAGASYPLVAANATVLAWLATCSVPMIQTRQRLRCHRVAPTPAELNTAGSVTARQTRRGREHIDVRVEIDTPEGRLWTSEVGFTPVATVHDPTPPSGDREPDTPTRTAPSAPPARLDVGERSLRITDDAIVQYSRRGNYHSDPETATALGLGGLVAQGTQVCGPAFAALLDEWGEPFLANGVLDVRFVGMVYGGDTVSARVAVSASLGSGERSATLQVWNDTRHHLAVVGQASSIA